MEDILEIINKQQISFLSELTNNMIHKLIKNIALQNSPVIFFTALYEENLKCLHAQLNYLNIDNQLLLREEKILKNIVLINKELLYQYYVKKDNINLADIIIFYNSEVGNSYYQLIYQIYHQYQKLDKRLPRMILLDEGYINNKTIFTKNNKNSYHYVSKKPEIHYSKKNFYINSPELLNELTSNVNNKEKYAQHLLIVPSKDYFYMASKKIKEKFKDFDVYTFDENIHQNSKNIIFTPLKNKNRIIITVHKCAALINFIDLKYIYDCCQSNDIFYGDSFVKYVSQNTANHIAKESKKYVFRACPEKAFRHLEITDNYHLSLEDNSKLILRAYQNDQDVSIDNEDTIVKFLERINLIRAGRVLNRSQNILSIPLGLRAANFIFVWAGKNLPVFPALVLSVIIDQCKNSLLYIPDTVEDHQEFIMTHYKKTRDDNIIIFYLNILLLFLTEKKDLNIDKEIIKKWCDKNYIYYNTFNHLLNKLIKTVIACRNYYNFDLALYDSKNVLDKAKNILMDIYSDDICESYDKIEHIYHDKNANSVILDKKRFNSGYFFFPERFISFFKINTPKSHDISLFYLIIED
jgi:hypothetical protein